jgi:hypothetical protein
MATITGATDYLENAVLQQLFNNSAYSTPTTLYIGLSTTTPTEEATGSPAYNFTEPTDTYTRQAMDATAGDWIISATAPTQAANTNDIEFPVAGASWGSITYVGIFDDDGTPFGNMLCAFSLTGGAQAINTGQQLKFLVGTLIVTLN